MIFMLRLFIYFIFIIFLTTGSGIFAGKVWDVVYIMPSGYPYSGPSLSSKKVYTIKLRFGVEIPAVRIIHVNGFAWFQCLDKDGRDGRGSKKSFFLPDIFVYFPMSKFLNQDLKSPYRELIGQAGKPDKTAGELERLEVLNNLEEGLNGSRQKRETKVKEPGFVEYYMPGKKYLRVSKNSGTTGSSMVGLDFFVDRWHPIPLFYEPNDLIDIPPEYRAPPSRNRDLKLRREALHWFIKMIDEAGSEGIEIKIISAYRSSFYQAMLYKRAIRNHGLSQKWVAKPGYSEHQLGTTCDLGTAESGYGLTEDFENTAAFRWLVENSYKYGIYMSYPRNSAILKGYNYEPWHFRYWGKGRFENKYYTDKTFFTR